MGGRTAAPYPPASLSGEGSEGGVAAVSAKEFGFHHAPAFCAHRALAVTALRQPRLKFAKLYT